jgi:hypothetical protein
MIQQKLADLWKAWDKFWFGSNSPDKMRLFRLIFCLMLFVFYCIRSLDIDLYFSNHGIAHTDILPEIVIQKYRYSLLTLFPSDGALWFFNSVLLVSLLLLAFGVLPRLFAAIVLIVHVSFIHRNPGGTYGVDTISIFYMLFLLMADFRKSDSSRGEDLRSILGSMAYRFSQIQLCVIYFYSGVHKLKGLSWWQGDALWNVMANAQLARWDFSLLTHLPWAIVGATYGTLIFEIYFPALVWSPKTRYPLLLAGVLMHVGIGLFMNIPYFAFLMVLLYVFFLPNEVVQEIYNRCVRFVRFRLSTSPASR